MEQAVQVRKALMVELLLQVEKVIHQAVVVVTRLLVGMVQHYKVVRAVMELVHTHLGVRLHQQGKI